MRKKRVVVGMSGGVDSSVAAYLLKEAGYDVVGVTMQIWPRDSDEEVSAKGGCCGMSAAGDAAHVAQAIGIPHYVMNFRQEFREKVIQYFMDEYLAGHTPNPCIACNRYVKWESLLHRSMQIGADYIATGHYARVEQLPNGRYAIRRSVTAAKDQTYALYNLTQEQLAHTLMPVGAYEKPAIRAIAEELGLLVAHKPDSQEICFVPDGDYVGFIEKNSTRPVPPPGNFVAADGRILGRHKGITHYTIGQRKGLNLSMGHPVFVTEIRPRTNEVVIGEAEDVFTKHLFCDHLNFMSIPDFPDGMHMTAKIRYNHVGAPATVRRMDGDVAEVLFDEPVRAVTPGQAVVFYDGDYVAGGGTIR
ncbi:MAG: tRNA 2-thiouridine(34) synthase MnmA [Clostridiales bacterium]|nr:tRNA 2-thiouridine(34) synthase MnmA [Clostridiales bacterium]